MALPKVRIFISSPGDVGEERVLANRLVDRLADEFAGQLEVTPVYWEHEPLVATKTPQESILRPSQAQIVICILWSRLGTPLPPEFHRPDGSRYLSGTEFEFEDAILGTPETKVLPDILAYRKTAEPLASLQDRDALFRRLEQKERLDAFIKKWFFNVDGTLKGTIHKFEKPEQFEQVLEEHLRRLLQKRLETCAESEAGSGKISWTEGSPFLGLSTFEVRHARVFFGRSRAVADVVAAMRQQMEKGRAFVLVSGISGGGKSSLARAGVVPLLTQPGVIEGVGLWRTAIIRPGDAANPLDALAAALHGAFQDLKPTLRLEKLAESLGQHPASACLIIEDWLSKVVSLAKLPAVAPRGRLLIVVDQLEEIFTLASLTNEDRRQFIAAISALARSGFAAVITTIRSDFYHRCVELPELIALKEGGGQYDLLLPTPAEISQMIRNPARAAGLRFEEDPKTKIALDELLRDAASSNPESLPLLEFALDQLYQRRKGNLLTYEAYNEMKGVEGALADHAEKVFNSLSEASKQTLPLVVRELVTISESSTATRRQCSRQSIATTAAASALVEEFIKARLFSSNASSDGTSMIAVTHEALLRHWPRVVALIDSERALFLVRSRISIAAEKWRKESNHPDFLLSEGRPLEEGMALNNAWSATLSENERQFIEASISRAAARKRNKRIAFAGLGCLALVTLLAGSYAFHQQNLAKRRLNDVGELMDQIYLKVDDAMSKISGSTPARRLLAENTLGYLERRRQEGENDSTFNLTLAQAFTTIGDRLGNHDLANDGKALEALDHYYKAEKLLEALVAHSPNNDQALRALERCYDRIGDVAENLANRREEELEMHTKALEVATKIFRLHPDDMGAGRRLAFDYVGVGDAYYDRGEFQKATENYERARDAGKAMVSGRLADLENEYQAKQSLGCGLERCSEGFSAMGETGPAREQALQALDVYKELSGGRFGADNIDMKFMLNQVYRQLAISYAEAEDLQSARKFCSDGLDVATSIYQRDTSNFHARESLWKTSLLMGTLEYSMGNFKSSLHFYKEGKALGEDAPSDQLFYQLRKLEGDLGVAQSLLRLGREDESTAELLDNALMVADSCANGDLSDARPMLALCHLAIGRWFANLSLRSDQPQIRRLSAASQAMEHLSKAAAVVKEMKEQNHFNAYYNIWFATLPAELEAAKKEPSQATGGAGG